MRTKLGITRALAILALASGLAAAREAEKRITLPADHPTGELMAGQGVEAVRASCIACHSTDYIVRQPGRNAKQWEAEVRKMVTVFGAPIDESEIQVIVQYLAANYGPVRKTPETRSKAPPEKQ